MILLDTIRCKILLYADDSVILISGKDTVYIKETLRKELHFVRDWLTDNKLSHIWEKLNIFCLEQNVDCLGLTR